MLPAQRTLRTFRNLDLTKTACLCIVVKEPIGDGRSNSNDQFEHLCGLDGPDHTGKHADHASFLATGHDASGGRGFEYATITCCFFWKNGEYASFKSKNGSVDERPIRKITGVINEEFRRKVVCAINDDVVVFDNVDGVVRVETLLKWDDGNIRIERLDFVLLG